MRLSRFNSPLEELKVGVLVALAQGQLGFNSPLEELKASLIISYERLMRRFNSHLEELKGDKACAILFDIGDLIAP